MSADGSMHNGSAIESIILLEAKRSRFGKVSFSFASALLGVTTLLASCASMEGDLGRPKQGGFLEDSMTLIGKGRAKLSGELYSGFNGTDEEKLMRDKAWLLIRPPHAQDWMSRELRDLFPSMRNVGLHVLTEAQRTRMTPVIDTAFYPEQYYNTLRAARYASHHVRYDRIVTDINQDREVFAAFIPAAERVVEMDHLRMTALDRLSDMNPDELKDAYARVDENRRFIGWVWRALQFRMKAYAYAIKHMEVETPSPKVKDANFALNALDADVQAQNGGLGEEDAGNNGGDVRKSRYTRKQWAKEDPSLIK